MESKGDSVTDDEFIDDAEAAWANGGIPFMLDHIGLDGAANEVNELIGDRDRYRRALEHIANRTYPAVYLGETKDGTKMYGASYDASRFAHDVLNKQPEGDT